MRTEERPAEAVALAAVFFLPMSALHPGFNITLGDVFLCLYLMLCWRTLRWRTGLPGILSVAVGIGVAVASVLASLFGRGLGDGVAAIQATLIFLVFLPLGPNALNGTGRHRMLVMLGLSATLQAVVAVLQLVNPDLRLPTQATSGLVEFGMRPVGLSGNPNGLGLVLTWSLPILVRLTLRSPGRWGRIAWSTACVLVILGGLATFSKITWVLIPSGLAVSLVMERGVRRELHAALAVVVALGAWTQREMLSMIVSVMQYRLVNAESLGDRLVGIESAMDHLGEWWLFGVGAGADLAYNVLGARIHNQMVGFAVQFGLPGAALLLGFFLTLLAAGLRAARRTGDVLPVTVFLLAWLALQVHPTYWARAHYVPVMILLAVVMRETAPDPRAEEVSG